MKIKNLLLSVVIGTALVPVFQSCGGGAEPKKEAATAKTEEVKPAAPANPYAEGEKIYNAKCIVCHQANGEGLPGAFPPLKNSDYLFADKVRAVAQALNGSNHEIVVNGVKYNAPMPQQVGTKEEAVAVINYVLNMWGNKGGTVSLEDVKDVVIEPRI
jgi:mono/diheme cytochrome c family protein